MGPSSTTATFIAPSPAEISNGSEVKVAETQYADFLGSAVFEDKQNIKMLSIHLQCVNHGKAECVSWK